MNSHLLSILLMRECKWTAADFFSYFLSFNSLLLFRLSARKKATQKSNCATARGWGAGGETRTLLFLKLVATDHPHGLCWVFIREACAFLPQPKTRPPPCTGPRKSSIAAHYRQQPIRAQGDSCAPTPPSPPSAPWWRQQPLNPLIGKRTRKILHDAIDL